jgi:hypothetical protein
MVLRKRMNSDAIRGKQNDLRSPDVFLSSFAVFAQSGERLQVSG